MSDLLSRLMNSMGGGGDQWGSLVANAIINPNIVLQKLDEYGWRITSKAIEAIYHTNPESMIPHHIRDSINLEALWHKRDLISALVGLRHIWCHQGLEYAMAHGKVDLEGIRRNDGDEVVIHALEHHQGITTFVNYRTGQKQLMTREEAEEEIKREAAYLADQLSVKPEYIRYFDGKYFFGDDPEDHESLFLVNASAKKCMWLPSWLDKNPEAEGGGEADEVDEGDLGAFADFIENLNLDDGDD